MSINTLTCSRLRLGIFHNGAAEVPTENTRLYDSWAFTENGDSQLDVLNLVFQKSSLTRVNQLAVTRMLFPPGLLKAHSNLLFFSSHQKKNKDKGFHRGNNSLAFPKASSALLPEKLRQHTSFTQVCSRHFP